MSSFMSSEKFNHEPLFDEGGGKVYIEIYMKKVKVG